ncbi:MAG TPA: SAM-dependent methyltransferase [Methylomirabilota bacterium]|nr:SAM-dependent methyltransferase [Methylomirabilota bacterium]
MSLRRALGRVPFARSTWHLARELERLVLYSAARARADDEQEFARTRDPWAFETDPVAGRDRFNRELVMLDAVARGVRFSRALEIGCAEGMFTEALAPRCDQLLAVDISHVALERARARCAWGSHVRFAEWDLRTDPLPGSFDLVVFEGVLDCFCQPWVFRAARDKVVSALVPGGHLLAGNPRQTGVTEGAWWGRFLVRGGKWIDAALSEHPELSVVSRVWEPGYVDTLFRKAG